MNTGIDFTLLMGKILLGKERNCDKTDKRRIKKRSCTSHVQGPLVMHILTLASPHFLIVDYTSRVSQCENITKTYFFAEFISLDIM